MCDISMHAYIWLDLVLYVSIWTKTTYHTCRHLVSSKTVLWLRNLQVEPWASWRPQFEVGHPLTANENNTSKFTVAVCITPDSILSY